MMTTIMARTAMRGITITMHEYRKSFAFLADRSWLRTVVRDAFGGAFWGFFLFAALTGGLTWLLHGRDIFAATFLGDVELLLGTLPRALVALMVAALVFVMLPRHHISAMVGQDSGLRGLAIATAGGTITPGGPASAYALLALLGGAGAERGALVAYITAWGMLGAQRVLLWDVPFMGSEFALLRLAICLPLPFIAGYLARWMALPMTLSHAAAPPPPAEGKA